MKLTRGLIVAALAVAGSMMICLGQEATTPTSRPSVQITWHPQDQYVPGMEIGVWFNAWFNLDAEAVREIIQTAPADVLSDTQKRALLAHAENIGANSAGDIPALNRIAPWQVHFLVDTPAAHPEEAEQLARGFVNAYECWMAKDGNNFAQKQLEAERARLAGIAAKKEEYQQQREKDMALLDLSSTSYTASAPSKSPEPPPASAIGELATKHVLLTADIAGIRARLEAARKLAASASAQYKPQVDLLVATAEVELADVQKRHETIAAMIPAIQRLLYAPLPDDPTRENMEISAWTETVARGWKPVNTSYKVEILYTKPASSEPSTIPAREWIRR